jgi:eukaryotic-like serine/threonine-protein kinase
MALTSGTKLGPYEIVAPIGAGGMGEVYRARDTRLDRTVAIKILPAHLSGNPEAKQRFDREARAISSLNHPNICTLHDVGHQVGIDFLVMEYLEGETLDHRLQKGPLPLKQALECTLQITDALEKAHRTGILHRDLKPGNIMLTASGAKLLDFGLAKPAAAVLGTSTSPKAGPLTPSTPTMNLSALSAPAEGLTQKGTVVGTFQYMAPEVLRGQEADARSDLFSLGCVLYEMVTGRRAFEGKSQLSVLTAILEKDPEPLSVTQPTAPAALDYTVRMCLEKNPEDRFQTAHDVKLQVAWLAKTGSGAITPAVATNEYGKPKAILGLAAAVLAIIAVASAVVLWRAQPVRAVTRATLLPPEGTYFAPLYRNGPPALSPDGTRLAFIASRGGKTSLWLRSLNKLDATELAGTEGAYYPFWSPDGHSIAFFANGRLWRMEASGGSPLAICNASDGRGGSWGVGDVILLNTDSFGSVARVGASGGALAQATLTQSRGMNESDRWPFFLPDGKHFLYLYSPIGAGIDTNEIRFASLDGKTNKLLLKGRYYNPEYALGWLLVGRSGTLVAQRLDPVKGELSGDPVQVADNLQVDDNVGNSVFSVSQNGVLVYLRGSDKSGMRHLWLDAAGKQLAQASELGVYGASRISPDGTKVATLMYEQSGDVNVWVWGLANGTRFRLSSGGMADTPVWSPDGRTIYYAYSPRGGHLQVYQRPVDGSRAPQPLIATQTDSYPEDLSTDGKWFLYQEALPDASLYSTLKALPLADKAKPTIVIDRVDFAGNAVLMPGNNEWVAYQSTESGRAEVYLTHFPNAGARYQVSPAGGVQPVWGKDGKKLYYLDAGQKLTAVEIRTEKDSVQVGAPRTLFQTSVMSSLAGQGYDLSRDGRFLVLNWAFETRAPMTLVMNWDAEVKK